MSFPSSEPLAEDRSYSSGNGLLMLIDEFEQLTETDIFGIVNLGAHSLVIDPRLYRRWKGRFSHVGICHECRGEIITVPKLFA